MARNVCKDPRLVPGGGAVEMAVSRALAGEADLQSPFALSMTGSSLPDSVQHAEVQNVVQLALGQCPSRIVILADMLGTCQAATTDQSS